MRFRVQGRLQASANANLDELKVNILRIFIGISSKEAFIEVGEDGFDVGRTVLWRVLPNGFEVLPKVAVDIRESDKNMKP